MIIYYGKIYRVDVIIMSNKKATSKDVERYFGILQRNIDRQRDNWNALYVFSKANTEPQVQSVVRRTKGLAELELIEEKVYECKRNVLYYCMLSEEFLEHLECFKRLTALPDFVGFTPEVLEEFEEPKAAE